MPEVNGKKFPYDKQGIIAAEQERGKPQPQQPQGQGARPPQPQGQGGSNTEFDKYVDNAMELLYSDEIASKLLKLGGNNKDSVEGMADMISMSVIKVDEKNGDQIPEDLILPLTEQVTQMVEELIEAQTKKPIPEQAVMKASQMAVKNLMEHYGVDGSNMVNALSGEDPAMIKKATEDTEAMFSKTQGAGRGQPQQGQRPQRPMPQQGQRPMPQQGQRPQRPVPQRGV
jgi:hypothetical protein